MKHKLVLALGLLYLSGIAISFVEVTIFGRYTVRDYMIFNTVEITLAVIGFMVGYEVRKC